MVMVMAMRVQETITTPQGYRELAQPEEENYKMGVRATN
jgi:hypothetical protein